MNPEEIDIDDLVTHDDLDDFEPDVEIPDVPSEDEIESIVQDAAERKTKAFLDHLANEDCDTESCQQIRDAFGIGDGGSGADPEPPEADDPDGDPDEPEDPDPTPEEKYPNAAFPEELEGL